VGCAVVWLIFAMAGGDRGFLTLRGTANYLEVAAQVGVVGVPVTLLMIAGEFDLSIGSMVGASGMVMAIAIAHFGVPVWAAVLLALGFALVVGFFQGYLVIKSGLPSFIITLAGLFALRGLAILIPRTFTGSTVVGNLGPFIAADPIAPLFNAEFGEGFPISLLWWLGLALVATVVLLRTPFGNWIYGTGGSRDAAHNLGVPTNMVKIILFMATSASAALLAAIQVMNLGSADANRGVLKEFEAIITAVIGGTLLSGGYGSVIGTVFGALTLGITRQGIFFAGIDMEWYQITLGWILLAAVLLNQYVRKRALKQRLD
jgi:simple sugar transport system permease protein